MIFLQMGNEIGIGNQFFRYAFARKMQIDLANQSLTVVYPNQKMKDNQLKWTNQLQYFNIQEGIAFIYQDRSIFYTNLTVFQKIFYIAFRLICKPIRWKYKMFKIFQTMITPFVNKQGLYLQEIGYIKNHKCRRKDIVINGIYECSKYFNGIEDILRKELTPRHLPLEKNRSLYDVIEKKESVCINIRRGNFLKSENAPMFNVCTINYFRNAIRKMKELHPDSVFIIFSDDISWCKENFISNTDEYYFETGDDPPWETLRLMSSCKHFIISNSTFAWWSQFLSRNQNKTVIAPERWYNIKGFDNPLLEESFIKLPTDILI
jgi:hypothetical protein